MDETPQIPQQAQPEQIPAPQPAPQIEAPHHPHKKHARNKHISIITAVVTGAATAFFAYRAISLRDFSTLNIGLLAVSGITFFASIGAAIRQHRKLFANADRTNVVEKVAKDLAEEVQDTKSYAEQAVAGKAPGKWKRRWLDFKDFVKECKRVWTITKKPNREEFKTIVKISGVGILLIGLIGFLIHFAREGLRFAGI